VVGSFDMCAVSVLGGTGPDDNTRGDLVADIWTFQDDLPVCKIGLVLTFQPKLAMPRGFPVALLNN
jgi:hypothetical protein